MFVRALYKCNLGVYILLIFLLLLSSPAYLLLLGLLLRAVNALEGLGDPFLLILFVLELNCLGLGLLGEWKTHPMNNFRFHGSSCGQKMRSVGPGRERKRRRKQDLEHEGGGSAGASKVGICPQVSLGESTQAEPGGAFYLQGLWDIPGFGGDRSGFKF